MVVWLDCEMAAVMADEMAVDWAASMDRLLGKQMVAKMALRLDTSMVDMLDNQMAA